MKDISKEACTGEKIGANVRAGFDDSLGFLSRWSWQPVHLALMLGVCIFPLVTPTFAHQGLDPEIQEITEELAKNPNDVNLLIQRAWNYRKNGEFSNSLADVERANQLDPGNQEVLLERGLTLSGMRRDAQAEAALNRFLEEGAAKVPGNIAARILDSSSSGISKRTSDKNVLQVALVERAHVHARRNKVGRALKDFTSAINIRPSTQLYLSRGQLQESLGKLKQAAAGYREGLVQMRNALPLTKALIRVEIQRQRYSKVLVLIDRELAGASVKTEWYLRRAEILDVMGRKKASQKAIQKALTEANRALRKRTTAFNRLKRAQVYLALNQQSEARRDLEVAVQMAPNLRKARELLEILRGQGQ